MNVADYIRKKQQAQNAQQNNQNYQTGQNNRSNPDISPQDALNKYSNMSEGDLMKELFKEGSVSSGKVSPQELDNFYNSASGFLSSEQLAKMRTLIEQLKRS